MQVFVKRAARAAFVAGAAAGGAALLTACERASAPQFGMPQVSVVTVAPERVPVSVALPGRVDAVRDAQIRARVTGIVQSIRFAQGSEVKKGDLLFTIDPAPAQAAFDQAAAQLKQVQADAHVARTLVERLAPLVKANAISRQEYDDAVARASQSEAAVAAAQAAVTTARINLDYTRVVSPISGRIGRPLVTEGALVEGTTATQMALVQQLDPVYVDFTQSTAELSKLRRAFASGALQAVGEDMARVEAILEDGSVYEHAGKLLFTGLTVDPGTGKVLLRAEFPNPEQILLPGMFVRVRLEQGVNDKALLVAQQALQRTADGRQSVLVVRPGEIEHDGQKMQVDTVTQVPVTVGPAVGQRVIITEGLQPGEKVVVEGFQKARPGSPVIATPWGKQVAANGVAGVAAGVSAGASGQPVSQ